MFGVWIVLILVIVDVPQRVWAIIFLIIFQIVLILVIVDVPQRASSRCLMQQPYLCLNPCYSGCPATGHQGNYFRF